MNVDRTSPNLRVAVAMAPCADRVPSARDTGLDRFSATALAPERTVAGHVDARDACRTLPLGPPARVGSPKRHRRWGDVPSRLRFLRRAAALGVLVLGATLATSCAGDLPKKSPPLTGFDEPIAFLSEPDDEAARVRLPLGTFSGLEVERATDAIEELLGGSDPGLRVQRIVENSPAAAAGLEVGDVLLSATVPGDDEPRALRFESEWRQIELESEPGDAIVVRFDRAAVIAETAIELEARVVPAARHALERTREESKVGIVVRTATEVEARRAGLGPGAGAVLSSAWRARVRGGPASCATAI
jgi:hypothetical protein